MATTMQIHRGDGSGRCYVIANVDSRLLPKLRVALRPVQPCSVIVSTAVSWSDMGRELRYRGQRVLLDLDVARVEVACDEDQVDAIAGSIRRALESESNPIASDGGVAAFSARGRFGVPASDMS